MTDEIDPLTHQIDRLLLEMKSVVLATADSDGSPLESSSLAQGVLPGRLE